MTSALPKGDTLMTSRTCIGRVVMHIAQKKTRSQDPGVYSQRVSCRVARVVYSYSHMQLRRSLSHAMTLQPCRRGSKRVTIVATDTSLRRMRRDDSAAASAFENKPLAASPAIETATGTSRKELMRHTGSRGHEVWLHTHRAPRSLLHNATVALSWLAPMAKQAVDHRVAVAIAAMDTAARFRTVALEAVGPSASPSVVMASDAPS